MTAGDGEAVVLNELRQLADLPEQVPGTRVQIAQSGYIFHCAGRVNQAVAEHFGWTQPNVWVPDPALHYMIRRHGEFSDHLTAIRLVIGHPLSVHSDDEKPGQARFIASADRLRSAGLLASSSVKAVDVLIELRSTNGRSYLRAFHLSPTRQPRGDRLWP